MRNARVFFVVLAVAALVALPATERSHGTFPGEPGLIVYSDFESILTVSSDGTPGPELVPGDATLQNRKAAVSADGRWVVFVRRDPPGGDFYLHKVRTDGLGLTNLGVQGFAPSWAPDGQSIVYVSGGDLWIVNADGTEPQPLLSLPEFLFHPVYAPDGGKIAFTRTDGNSIGTVWLVDSDGGGLEQVTTPVGETRYVEWSPDGARLLFFGDLPGLPDWGIFVVNADGSELDLLIPGAVLAAWSPDGEMIAFAIEGDLFVANADGSDPQLIATVFDLVHSVDWAIIPEPLDHSSVLAGIARD